MSVFTALVIALALLGALVGIALYDYRHLLWFRNQREWQAFHCLHCDHVFAVRARKRIVSCPYCGAKSQRLRF